MTIIDDIGLLPVSRDAAEGFHCPAYGRRALAVNSNLTPRASRRACPGPLATATNDRLMHHAHIGVTRGDSFRITLAASGRQG
ncbi:ATP-binding protein [Actinomadura sp. NPDC048955]|uniref:ATP-binding protein n=1 Tax=Actinomadura sp. NPDC048955 TaxID=3158228 RepID=UPI0033E3BA91